MCVCVCVCVYVCVRVYVCARTHMCMSVMRASVLMFTCDCLNTMCAGNYSGGSFSNGQL